MSKQDMNNRDLMADLVAVRHRLVWSWAEHGATPQQILAKLKRSAYDMKYVQDALLTHPDAAGKSIYYELSAVSQKLVTAEKEAKEEHDIAVMCTHELARFVAELKEKKDQLVSVRSHNEELIKEIEKLEGKLEKYEDSEGNPVRRSKRKKHLEDRVIELEEELGDRLDGIDASLVDIEERLAGLEGD